MSSFKLAVVVGALFGVAIGVGTSARADFTAVPGAYCRTGDAGQPFEGRAYQARYNTGVSFFSPTSETETVFCAIPKRPDIHPSAITRARAKVRDGFGCYAGQDFPKGKVTATLCHQSSNNPFGFMSCGAVQSTTCQQSGVFELVLPVGSLPLSSDVFWAEFELGEGGMVLEVKAEDT